jgi:hypothetical protein
MPDGELRLTIIRADGTVHDLGLTAAHYRNPLRRAWWNHVGKRLSARRHTAANRDAARRAALAEED